MGGGSEGWGCREGKWDINRQQTGVMELRLFGAAGDISADYNEDKKTSPLVDSGDNRLLTLLHALLQFSV